MAVSESTMVALLAFRHEREWKQFHTPKNLAIAISVEAGELLELFQWTRDEFGEDLESDVRQKIADEMADVAILLAYLTHDLGLDLDSAVRRKLELNASRYPVEKSRGTATKYNAL